MDAAEKRVLKKKLVDATVALANVETILQEVQANMEKKKASLALLVKQLDELEIEDDDGGEEFYDVDEWVPPPPFASGDKVVRANPCPEERRHGKRATGIIAGFTRNGRVSAQFDDRKTQGHYKPKNLIKYTGDPPSLYSKRRF